MSSQSSSSAPKNKWVRPTVNKPAWAQSASDLAKTNENFFSRANETYTAIVAEKEAKRKKKSQKKSDQKANGGEGRDRKRMRISSDSDSEDTDSEKESVKVNGKKSKHNTRGIKAEKGVETKASTAVEEQSEDLNSDDLLLSPPASNSIKIEGSKSKVQTESQASAPIIIDLEDDDDELYNATPPPDPDLEITAVEQKPAPQEVHTGLTDSEEEDEEFQELKRKAREEARRKRLEADAPTLASPGASGQPARDTKVGSSPSAPTPAPDDPILRIQVGSRIPGTKPIKFKYRLGQALKALREHWCRGQGIPEHKWSQIFLMFGGFRVFDVNSCASMGITVDENGDIDFAGQDAIGDARQELRMEAITQEILDQDEKRDAAIAEGKHDEEEEMPTPKAPAEKEVKLALRAKGYEVFLLKVKPVSCLSTLDTAHLLMVF